MVNKNKKSLGKISSIFLILAVVLIILVIVVFVVVKLNATKKANDLKAQQDAKAQVGQPVRETTVGNVRFVFISAKDLGNTLLGPVARYQQYQDKLTTTERFIQVIIGAQNKGKLNFPRDLWDVGNIVDSEGRNYVSINDQAYAFVPTKTLCGTLLKPEFDPTPCLKLYEVSKESTGLKIEVNITNQTTTRKQESFIDLNVTK